jgi:hypothetical protein
MNFKLISILVALLLLNLTESLVAAGDCAPIRDNEIPKFTGTWFLTKGGDPFNFSEGGLGSGYKTYVRVDWNKKGFTLHSDAGQGQLVFVVRETNAHSSYYWMGGSQNCHQSVVVPRPIDIDAVQVHTTGR